MVGSLASSGPACSGSEPTSKESDYKYYRLLDPPSCVGGRVKTAPDTTDPGIIRQSRSADGGSWRPWSRAVSDAAHWPRSARATPALWQTSLGLFDYWGCPWGQGDEVIALAERLRRAGPR